MMKNFRTLCRYNRKSTPLNPQRHVHIFVETIAEPIAKRLVETNVFNKICSKRHAKTASVSILFTFRLSTTPIGFIHVDLAINSKGLRQISLSKVADRLHCPFNYHRFSRFISLPPQFRRRLQGRDANDSANGLPDICLIYTEHAGCKTSEPHRIIVGEHHDRSHNVTQPDVALSRQIRRVRFHDNQVSEVISLADINNLGFDRLVIVTSINDYEPSRQDILRKYQGNGHPKRGNPISSGNDAVVIHLILARHNRLQIGRAAFPHPASDRVHVRLTAGAAGCRGLSALHAEFPENVVSHPRR